MAITVTVCVYVIPRGMTACICFLAGANSRSDVLRAVRRVEYGFVAGWVESRQISHSTAAARWTAADFWTRHITRTRGGSQDWTVSARRSVATSIRVLLLHSNRLGPFTLCVDMCERVRVLSGMHVRCNGTNWKQWQHSHCMLVLITVHSSAPYSLSTIRYDTMDYINVPPKADE